MLSRVGRTLIGSRLASTQAVEERLSNFGALGILGADALSSVAYAAEELLAVLVLGGAAALTWTLPVSIAIVGLLVILIISYQQLIRAYPMGGGAYTVAKENLGTTAGLVAASGLLLDYILTVAVSISAGAAALTSAFGGLAPYKIEIALVALVVLTIVNLRGVRETGRAFVLPTMLFVGSTLVLLVVGMVKVFTETGSAATQSPVSQETVASVGIFLLLRAFSSGCAALTGVEAVSNRTQVFKPPEARNAARTLAWMGIILATLFLGSAFLARHFSIIPAAHETVLSQLARVVFGGGPLYYLVQIATLMVLVMAANTAFVGFPRLSSILGQDRYLPRQLSDIGSRLVYTNGILLLALLSGVIIASFGASVHRLIPIYAVGVFISFPLSQAGMVRHWLRERDEGWRRGAVINGFGAVLTGIALFIIAITKFAHGAWIVTLLVPLVLYIFARIHNHYEMVATELSLEGFTPPVMPRKHLVIVPVSGIHRAVLEALAYAKSIATDVRAVYVYADPEQARVLQDKWRRYAPDVPLELIHSPYRLVITELLKYLDTQIQEDKTVSVLIPEFVPMHWWEMLLHSQTAGMLKAALLFRKRIPVISVPHHLRR